jgi:hypothetical protein
VGEWLSLHIKGTNLELPPAVARAFVDDMKAYVAETDQTERDAIADATPKWRCAGPEPITLTVLPHLFPVSTNAWPARARNKRDHSALVSHEIEASKGC